MAIDATTADILRIIINGAIRPPSTSQSRAQRRRRRENELLKLEPARAPARPAIQGAHECFAAWELEKMLRRACHGPTTPTANDLCKWHLSSFTQPAAVEKKAQGRHAT
jgi:hypothetical protein